MMLCAPAFAKGELDPDVVEAKRHFERGLAHYNLREYLNAIEEFESAYRFKPDPVFLYNLGQAHRLANDPEHALYFYKAYLRNLPNAENRAEVEGRIAELEHAPPAPVAKPPEPVNQPCLRPRRPRRLRSRPRRRRWCSSSQRGRRRSRSTRSGGFGRSSVWPPRGSPSASASA